ncbi:hypothetical protein FZEAL_10158 [Fusarium zealandicum]|uniref:lytic cellulose monooxygenase (C4-dehydrogenating) n=1 Tax=Fusarium zealandicum TaxID=1053134 RepID=A0A8H4U4M9_9HYPO|nr:hypothetical protein FZEAL_10158 [Fusarium zealandicum]
MHSSIYASFFTALLASTVSAHGHVAKIVADGETYTGGIPHSAPADAVGWAAGNQDNGFVAPDAFNTEDILCHKDGKPVKNAVTVAAGNTVTLTWDTWPESHKGPVTDYLAPVAGAFTNIDKSRLKFAKIAEQGLVSGSNPGKWASDALMADSFSWDVTIPANLKPGNYVLRHEILALHSAGQENGAQAYPQCINIKVTGSGTGTLKGGDLTTFYKAADPGVLFNLYGAFSSYEIPGPKVQKV